MKRVIRFSRLRLVMVLFSAALIATGIVALAVKGLNYGIDFKGGLNPQVQIAPVALRLTATGADSVSASSYAGERQILGGDAIQFTVVNGQESEVFRFAYADYATLGALVDAIHTIPGVEATLVADRSLTTDRLFSVDLPVDIVSTPLVINHGLAEGDTPYADIEKVRAALSALGDIQVQTLGAATSQQFLIKVAAPEDTGVDARAELEARVESLLTAAFNPGEIIVQQIAYVSPSLAGELAVQTISVVLVALALMLIYLSFRFKFEYALAVVLCVVHDSAVMFSAVAVLGLEFSTSVVAAILTIIGYSVNDTIVIFDRVRENQGLMRDSDETLIFDTSLSQTLGRTLITSFVTLLAVVSLYVFTTGSLKDFSLLLIVGILVGSYSTIYIASPIVMLWHRIARNAQRRRETKKFGVNAPHGELPAEPRTTAAEREAVPVTATVTDDGDATEGGAGAPAVATPQGPVVRQQPSRKKKKRR